MRQWLIPDEEWPRVRRFVIVWLALQIGLPTILLILAHTFQVEIRLGWQMFARVQGLD